MNFKMLSAKWCSFSLCLNITTCVFCFVNTKTLKTEKKWSTLPGSDHGCYILSIFVYLCLNKANLRDLIAATGLVILLKFDPNHRFFWFFKNLMDDPGKQLGHLFYTTSSFVHHFKSIGELKLKLQSKTTQIGSKTAISCPVWPWNLMDDLGKQ